MVLCSSFLEELKPYLFCPLGIKAVFLYQVGEIDGG